MRKLLAVHGRLWRSRSPSAPRRAPTSSRSASSTSAPSATTAGPTSTTRDCLAVEEAFGDKVETVYVENVAEGPDAERAITRLARDGAGIIFTTSFGYMDPTNKVAKNFPEREVRARHRLQARPRRT